MTAPAPRTGNDAPWYRQKIFWMLMSGPIIVVIAGIATFVIAARNDSDLVSDDYYKDGKHINLQLARDEEAARRRIRAQVLFNPEGTAARVFVGGDYDRKVPLRLLLLHPVQKAGDQTAKLKAADTPQSGDQTEYTASFAQALPKLAHWYVRLEDSGGQWRVEAEWQPAAGAAVNLLPKTTAAPVPAALSGQPEKTAD